MPRRKKLNKGFRLLTKEQRKAVSALGGIARQKQGNHYVFTKDDLSKGGKNSKRPKRITKKTAKKLLTVFPGGI